MKSRACLSAAATFGCQRSTLKMTRGPASEGPLEIETRCNFRLKCDSNGDSAVHEMKKGTTTTLKRIDSIKHQLFGFTIKSENESEININWRHNLMLPLVSTEIPVLK